MPPKKNQLDEQKLAEMMSSTAKNAVKELLEEQKKSLAQSLKQVDAKKDEEELPCPTCHAGHAHKVHLDKNDGLYKCDGPDCGQTFQLLTTKPEYHCTNCGVPTNLIKEDLETTDTECPTCGMKNSYTEIDKNKTRKYRK